MKIPPDIEELLKTLAPDSAGFDRAGVKQRLMHSVTAYKVPSPYQHFFRVFSGSLAMLFIVFAGISYASLSSLPGEPLYAMKVNVTEELVALTKQSPNAALDYAIERLETRHIELVSLRTAETAINGSVFDDLTTQVAEDINTISVIVDSIGYEEGGEVLLPKLAKVKSLVEDNNNITDELFATATSSVESVTSETEATTLFESEVAEYVATTASTTVAGFVSEQLSEIEDVLFASTTPATLQTMSEAKLQEMTRYLSEEKFTEALIETLELAEDLEVGE